MIYLLKKYKIVDLNIIKDDVSISVQDKNCIFLPNKNVIVDVNTISKTLIPITEEEKGALVQKKAEHKATIKSKKEILAENELEKKKLKETIENMKIVIADLLADDDTTAEKSKILEEVSEIKVARDKLTPTKEV